MEETGRVDELERLGSGRQAEVFAWGTDRVLRLARDASQEFLVEREALALAAAHRAGAPVPALYERLTVAGRPGMVLDRLDEENLVGRLGRRPWEVWSLGRAMGAVHAQLHQVLAPDELPSLRVELGRRLESELVPAALREHTLGLLEKLPDGDRLYHGDFHPANLLPAPGRVGYLVIDWTNGARGHPSADVARTCVILGGRYVPPDSPPVVRRLARIGRAVLMRGYLRGYGKEGALDRSLVERWEPVMAAARLVEGIDEEREHLLAVARGE